MLPLLHDRDVQGWFLEGMGQFILRDVSDESSIGAK
jgi:hypothetical protein